MGTGPQGLLSGLRVTATHFAQEHPTCLCESHCKAGSQAVRAGSISLRLAQCVAHALRHLAPQAPEGARIGPHCTGTHSSENNKPTPWLMLV